MSLSRTPLKRGTKKRLRRYTGLKQVSDKKRAAMAEAAGVEVPRPVRLSTLTSVPRPAIPASARRKLRIRSEDKCEIRIPQAGCTWWAAEASHRDGRGMGGHHGEALVLNNRPVNLMFGCVPCHRFLHRYPKLAEDLGLFVTGDHDPAVVEVWRRGRRVQLCDVKGCPWGGVHDHGPWASGAGQIDDEGQVAA